MLEKKPFFRQIWSYLGQTYDINKTIKFIFKKNNIGHRSATEIFYKMQLILYYF